ncbi:Mpv17/PMP22 [Cordyceps fumosorosea ARSEF 2679]|uniref:Mpv17/PMP22 n=1 Tax=Cordyceps fumosorosea (strain ARSEF 2679) TaxID=1081104 RepID=A0A167QMA6_CORFA|nr:Mpv17/PMP22 [Cordyceps fumosorosea ARSEF 2679]OAA57769.1 Mpv17/PMP22 [Cordyceps fumosorosea ARSEF 2679]
MRSPLLQTSLRQRLLVSRRNPRPQFRANSSSSQPKPSAGAADPPSTSTNSASAAATEAAAKNAAPTSIWMRLGPLTQVATAFGRAQQKRPYVVQTLSAMVIFIAADVSAQNISGSEYDPVRTTRTTFIGALFAIPQYRWFHVLARYFNYKSKALSIAAKVAFNQVTFAVAFPTYFFGMQALLSGESLSGTLRRLQDTVPRSWQNSWKVWPAAMAFNLSFVPLEYRALFSGMIAIGWQTYLSWMNRQAELKEKAEVQVAEGDKIQALPIQAAVAV